MQNDATRQNIASLYRQIFEIIDDTGLSPDDFVASGLSGDYFNVDMLTSTAQPAVGKVVSLLADAGSTAQSWFPQRQSSGEAATSLSPPQHVVFHFTSFDTPVTAARWETDRELVLTELPKVATLYSGFSIFSTYQMIIDDPVYSGESNRLEQAPRTFFDLVFVLKPLLLRGEAVVLPSRVVFKLNMGIKSVGGTRYSDLFDDNRDFEVPVIQRPTSTPRTDALLGDLLRAGLTTVHGLSLEDMVKFREDQSDEFKDFQHALALFIRMLRDEPDIKLKATLKELEYQCDRLTRRYQEAASQLRSRGVDVVAGSLATILALSLPPPWSAALSGLLGTKTAVDGIRLLREKAQIPATLRDSEYWWFWMLSKESSRKRIRNV